MNYEKISAEGINKITQLVKLSHDKIKLLEELRLSMLHHAIEHDVCKLETYKTGKLVRGAKCVWTTTNGVGETVTDEVLLSFDDYKRVVKDIDLTCAHSATLITVKRQWNKKWEQGNG